MEESTGNSAPMEAPTQETYQEARKRVRARYTNSQKLAMVRTVKKRAIAGDESIRSVCAELSIQPQQYRRWLKQTKEMGNKLHCESVHKGPTSILGVHEKVEKELLRFIFETREQGMEISVSAVVVHACRLIRDLRDKKRETRFQIVRRWLKQHSFVYRMGTHVAQKHPSEMAKEATDFVEMMRPIVNAPNRHQDFIINMDQTPVPFTFNAKKTLELIGTRTVHLRKSTNDTKRVTFAMTVTASGKYLTPLLVFKGSRRGRIAKTEFPTFPQSMLYACQPNAWMDEEPMAMWVEKVLKPHVEKAPVNVVPLLLLDSYRCHMMASIVETIQELGVEVQHIPGGCTGLVQPVDVGINKPFKNRCRDRWESWMIADGLLTNTTKPPTRALIAQWCDESLKEVTPQIVRNAWRHGTYSYFPLTAQTREEAERQAALDASIANTTA